MSSIAIHSDTSASPLSAVRISHASRELAVNDPMDRAIEWTMYALLAFLPLAYGAVDAWSEMFFIAIVWAMALLLLLRLIRRPQVQVVWTWMYVPIVLFVGLAVLQLIPLPAAAIKFLSPSAYQLRARLTDGAPPASERWPLSLYPYGTAHDLRLLLSVACIFVIVVNVFRGPAQIKRLLTVIAAVGCFEAGISLAQFLTGTSRIYWTVPMIHRDSGTFANHSHFGQFINLSLGAALGMLLIRLRELSRSRQLRAEKLLKPLSDWVIARVWLLGLAILFCAGTLFLSLTRGGIMAALAAGVLSAIPITRQLGGRRWGKLVLFLIVISVLLGTSVDQVFNRLETLKSAGKETHGRGQILLDVLGAWHSYPLLGTGLGSFEVVYPSFQHLMTPDLVEHADDEYAQLLFETGAAGVCIVAAFLAGIIVLYLKCLGPHRPAIMAAAPGLGFGLIAILIHSGTDFGQHLPAIASLTAIFAGLLVVLCDPSTSAQLQIPAESAKSASELSRLRWGLRLASVVLALLCAGWALIGVNSARAAEMHWWRAVAMETVVQQQNWDGSNQQYATLISEASAAAADQPSDVRYAHWLNVYRWEAVARLRDPATGEVIHNDQTISTAQRVTSALHSLGPICPTFAQSLSVAGQLERTILGQEQRGDADIERAITLSPCDPNICSAAGAVAASKGDWDAAANWWKRGVTLDPGQIPVVLQNYTHIFHQPEKAFEVVGDDVECAATFLSLLPDPTVDRSIVGLRTKLIDYLKNCDPADMPEDALCALGNAWFADADYSSAAQTFRQLIDVDESVPYYRLRLAQSLWKLGRTQEALDQTRYCLRLEPQYGDARRLLGDLNVMPGLSSSGIGQ
jgi:tetratricopeptide (TPR) repeat protein